MKTCSWDVYRLGKFQKLSIPQNNTFKNILLFHAAEHSSIAQRWPPLSKVRCSQTTKLKAMYGGMAFDPPLSQKPMTSFEVDVEWNDLQFHPTENTRKRGGVYVSYTMGMKNGPGGYFGVQFGGTYGEFFIECVVLRLEKSLNVMFSHSKKTSTKF